MKSSSLPSQLTLHHEPIKKKLKPGIDHDYLLLWFVGFLTKVDWSITGGFYHVPLLLSNNNFQALENVIPHGKPFCPLLHFLGLSPYIMNSKKQNNCPLQQKNTENTLQHPGHMFSHVPINAKTNTVRRDERINALQSYTLQNFGFRLIILTQTF
jgi:hypothetical protein